MMRSKFLLLVPLSFLAIVWVARTEGRAGEPVRFNRDIRPILSDTCFACHGFDEKKREAELRLDVAEGAFADRPEGAALVPGKLDESLLWQRICSTDPDQRMPPAHFNKTLSSDQKNLLKQWIAEGAKYERHWAFEPPASLTPPNSALHPVDAFLQQRIDREKLTARGEASRELLIRRLSYALTGLPPTLEELDQFLDDRSPYAYESMVDRYLHSDRLGEEMARHWLDVARYADTHGLHLDNEREMWAYRDWVIRAFNENLPFDQFTLWQLAGDLLPEPTNEQLIATGFGRCNVTTSEGGAIDDEYRFLYAVDRTSTMIETWMGLTGGCAVCHDHKFDPISTREFYSLYAFFNNAADPPMDKNIARTAPFLKLPTMNEQQAVESAESNVQQRLRALQKQVAKWDYVDPAEDQAKETEGKSTESSSSEHESAVVILNDLFPFGSTSKSTTRNPSTWDRHPAAGVKSGIRSLKQASSYFTEDAFDSGAFIWKVPRDASLSVWVCLDSIDTPSVIALSLKQGSEHVVYWGDEDLESYGFPDKAEAVYAGQLPKTGPWVELNVSSDLLKLDVGLPITNVSIQQSGGIVWWDAMQLRGTTEKAEDPFSSFIAWWQLAKDKKFTGIHSKLAATLKAGPKKVDDSKARQELLEFYLAHVARPNDKRLARFRSQWENALTDKELAEESIRGTMIFNDQPRASTSYVMERGQYNKPTIEVQPDVPAIMPALTKPEQVRPPNRLDLARWLIDPTHPLTARVTVNRFWQQLFGLGLVKTSHDFGSQGEPPSHPELLDWLAIDFRDSGWDVKRLIRMLVTSQAFRRDSTVEPISYQRDPENRWLARGPRFRLDAEPIRDTSLFVSGLLSPRRGGRGSMPYQPPNIWEPVGYQNSNTRYYLQGHGDDLYRRSIYCFLKRTAPPPFMSNFDGPNREQFCTRRERSNTPLQALQLMNDVQHFEAARAFAERILEDSSDDRQRLGIMFRTVLARMPDDVELKHLRDALGRQKDYYQQHAEDASRVLSAGESKAKRHVPDAETAAWTMIANLILNLDEAMTRN